MAILAPRCMEKMILESCQTPTILWFYYCKWWLFEVIPILQVSTQEHSNGSNENSSPKHHIIGLTRPQLAENVRKRVPEAQRCLIKATKWAQLELKCEQKEMELIFGRITKNLWMLEQNCYLKGENELLRWLKWGIVRLCSSKIARDMARNVNVSILRFLYFLRFSKENSSIFTKSGFCQKIFLDVSIHISGNFWVTETYNTSF